MPVDFIGVLLAFVFWITATRRAYLYFRQKESKSHNAANVRPVQQGRAIFLTMCAAVVLAGLSFFIAMAYDLITVGW